MAYTAVKDGDWSDPTVWGNSPGGDYPGKLGTTADQTVNFSGYTITYDIDNSSGNGVRHGSITGGNLNVATDQDTYIWIRGTFAFQYGDEFNIGSSSSPLSSSYTCTIEYDMASDTQYRKFEWFQGHFSWYGANKTSAVELGAALSASGTAVTLASTPTGWAVGDQLYILSSSETGTARYIESEYATISAITGTSVTLSTGVTYAHSQGTLVLNLTRNIRLISTNNSYQPNSNTGQCAKCVMHSVEFNNVRQWGWELNQNEPAHHKNCTFFGSLDDGINIRYTGGGHFEDCIVADNNGNGVDANENYRSIVWESSYFVNNDAGIYSNNTKYSAQHAINCVFACNSGDGVNNGRTPGGFYTNCYFYGNFDYGYEGGYNNNAEFNYCFFGIRADGTSHTNFDADFKSSNGFHRFNDCKFNSSDIFDIDDTDDIKLWSSNHNQIANTHRAYSDDGDIRVQTDTSVYRTSSPSLKFSGLGRNQHAIYKIPIKVSSGDSLTVTIYGKRASTSFHIDPYAVLHGCGIADREDWTTNDTNWNSISLTGTAARDGVVICTVVMPQNYNEQFNIDDVDISVS